MDIIVKSFNRPYYLERCLHSIYKFADGDFRIKVLDDGTPPQYLERIQEVFPDVIITTSPLYEDKVVAIQAHIDGQSIFNQRTIPTKFWIEQIARSSSIFLLLEDDIWLTGSLSLDSIEKDMQANHLDLVKISWLGNPATVTGDKQPVGSGLLQEIIPKIPLASEFLVLDRFKVRSTLKAMKLMRLIRSDFKLQLPVYTLYGVASAFFNKKYWLYLWEGSQLKVDEVKQLQKAGLWYKNKKGRYAKSNDELTKTSFTTSATNVYKGVDLDVFVFNHLINEAWLKGEFDTMQNFPKDFDNKYIMEFLNRANDSRASFSEWEKWVQKFQAQYLSFGCKVE